ncbi:MAG TPA: ABC transporter permease [Vicinamibacterales bacterium]|nr:ABC transporter permease [Vicinamibacterales bacterium]
MGTLTQDLAYAWRTLQRSPGFAIVAVLTLGLGIGATTTIFTIVNGVLLRPLPSYREPDRLASLWVDFGVGAQSLPVMSPGDFRDYQQRNRSFEMLAAGTGAQVIGATGALTGTGGEPERVEVTPVTASFLPLLGVNPIVGRHFTAEEEAIGGPRVVMLSYGLWQRRYGGDPSIVGRSIRLDGVDQTVVGVMPREFRLWLPAEAFLITDAQIWKPLQYDYANQPPRNFTLFTVFGRLKPGVTFAQAQSDLDGIARRLRAEHPVHEAGDMRIRVVPLQDDVVKHARQAIVSLFVAVGFVLLIACANVAHLLLARATSREREMAVRGALGATRRRLLRQLATESVALAAGGLLVGLVVARAGTQTLALLNPANLPKLEAVRIDGAALLFAAGASLLTAVIFGLVPALRAAGIDLNRTLRATGSAAQAQVRLRGLLMVGEMALALVLLIGAGLMVRSFVALQQVRPGFDPGQVHTFRTALPIVKYPNPPARLAFLKRMDEQLRAIPGVTDVGFTTQLPLSGSGALFPFAYNEETARNWESETSDGRFVSPHYFRAMGTRRLAGRVFDEHDQPQHNRIVVDETLAARAWPGESAVGKRLQVGPNGTPNNFAEVIGVVEHVRIHDLSRAVRPQMYRVFGAGGRPSVVIRASVPPAAISRQVEAVMKRLDPDLPLDRLQPMSAYVSDALAQTRLNLIVMSFFGGAALLLSCVGIYGVFSYSVSQRTREIGIRMALGQDAFSVRNQVLAEGLRMAAISAAIGLAAAVVLTRSVDAMLYGVKASDPATFATMAALLIVVAMAGCYVPARRATRVQPIVALKTD